MAVQVQLEGSAAPALLDELTWLLAGPDGEHTVLIGHRGARAGESHLLAFSLTPLGAGEVLARAEAIPCAPGDEAMACVLRAVRTVQALGLAAAPLSPARAARRVVAAARASVAAGIGLGGEGCAVVETLLAAGGLADAAQVAARLAQLPRWDVVDPGLGEEGQAPADELVAELIEWYERERPDELALGAAACMADAMAAYRLERGDPGLGAWSTAELEDLLLEWLPRSIVVAGEQLGLVAPAVATVLRFLAASGRMSRGRAEGLAARALELAPAYAAAAADPLRRGDCPGPLATAAAGRRDGPPA